MSSEWGASILLLVVGAFAGAALALSTVPAWLPVLGSSLVGADAKVFWYLSRASAFTAFVLLWISMASGLIISDGSARHKCRQHLRSHTDAYPPISH